MANLNGAIYGIVSEEGVPKVGTVVALMDHTTMQIIGETVTDQYGGYMFNNLDPEKTNYMLVAVDDDGVEPKNALIKDYVTPIKTANGTLGGNFTSVVDALTPCFARIPFASASGDTTFAAPFGGSHRADAYDVRYGSLSAFETTHSPIPSNPLIIGARTSGAVMGDTMPPSYTRTLKDLGYQYPLAPTTAPLTLLATCYNQLSSPTNIAVATMSQASGTSVIRDTASDAVTYSGGEMFGTSSSVAMGRDTLISLSFENNELRVKFVQQPVSGVPTVKRTDLVCALTDATWYMATLRVGVFDGNWFVDVTNMTTKVTTTYTMTTPIVGFNIQSTYASYGSTRRRFGMMVFGSYMTGALTATSGSTAGYFGPSMGNCVNSIYGPMIYWNRALSDSEALLLHKAAKDTATVERYYPRFLSEVQKYVPALHYIGDRHLNQVHPPYSSLNHLNDDSVFTKHNRVCLQLGNPALERHPEAFSSRRRVQVRNGVELITNVWPLGTKQQTVIAFFQDIAGSSGALWGLYHLNAISSEDVAHSQMALMELTSDRRIRCYQKYSGGTFYDNYFQTQAALATPGNHSVAWVTDTYAGLTTRLYVDGVYHSTIATTQQIWWSCHNGLLNGYGPTARMFIGAAPDGAFNTALGISRANINISDLVWYQHLLVEAEIKEIHDSWVAALGPDSHA